MHPPACDEEPDLRIRFTLRNGEPAEMVIEDPAGPHRRPAPGPLTGSQSTIFIANPAGPYMHYRWPSYSLFALLLAAIPAQAPAQAQPALPGCRENLDSLAHRIALNYSGLRLEVTGERRREYDQLLARLRADADRTRGEDCYRVLSSLTGWFQDPHLFVYQSVRVDSAEVRRRASAVQTLPVEESEVRAYLERAGPALDPIEGIWYEAGLRVAVIPEPGAGPGRFVALVLAPDTAIWPRGAVRARFTRRADGGYATEMWLRNFARRELEAHVYKRVLLRMSPGTWGKEYPVRPEDEGLLAPADPRRPTLLLRPGTVVVSLPSHDPAYRPVLDSLVTAHAGDLATRPRLIVDLRGNEGGASWMSDALRPYIATRTRRPTPFDGGEDVMLSSPDQIAYARRAFGPDTSRFVRSLLERLQARPGELVPFAEPGQPEPPRMDSVIAGPRCVGVMVDRGTVSASEVLVLAALRSERTRVFGEPTAGALDYPSTNVVPLSSAERRWLLGHPTLTRIPVGPGDRMRGRGIPPDVPVDWASVPDPIAHVERALNCR
jgi:Peptidase family S41